MSRIKKSRKSGSGAIGVVKVDKKSLASPSPKKPKKKKGKPSGNRQQEAIKKKIQTGASSELKDPRVGSKKPIDLGKPHNEVSIDLKKAKNTDKKQPAIAAVRPVIEPLSYEDQITRIEQDETLLAIIEKQEQEQPLTSEEVDYYNELMEQHEQLSALIEAPSEEVELATETVTENDLWEKLDSSDLSKFE